MAGAKLGPIEPTETDVDILNTAISLGFDGRSFAKSLALYDQLLAIAETRADRLRALALKAAMSASVMSSSTW